MCGINGYFSQKKVKNLRDIINKMNDSILHRGPDDDGVYVEDNQEYSLAMGMRRLSIIDLKSGKQPIFSVDKSKVIVFNGEIYNYQVLRSKLISKGAVFHTKSDTEVIIRLYEFYGVNSFSMLDGMFAFSIYDKTLDRVFIVRDFFGEKPLYYSHLNDNFYWASELKSIKRVYSSQLSLSKDAVSLFLQLTYIPAPYTIYDNIYKLEPNNYIEFDCRSKKFSQQKIYEPKNKSNLNFKSISFNEAKKVTRDLIFDSVKSRSVSDVPLGTFLSGGVDSSIVSYCLNRFTDKKIDTFSIGFEKKSFDETKKARTISKLIDSNHHEYIISAKDLSIDIDSILLNYDEPFADPSALPTYLLSKYTSEYVKVALTGDGGDEMFGGYNKYYMGKINFIYTKIISENIHRLFLKASSLLLKDKSDKRIQSNYIISQMNKLNITRI